MVDERGKARGSVDASAVDEVTLTGFMIEIAHGLNRTIERWLLDDYDMPLVTFEVLLRLSRSPGQRLRLAELADQVTITRSGLTRAVDRLEADGLVRRRRCEADGRGVWAELTLSGAERLRPIVDAHVEYLRTSLLSGLSSDEQRELMRLLEAVRDRANEPAARASGRP